VLPTFHDRVSRALSTLPVRAEILYVNDGSTDDTLRTMRSIAANDDRVGIIDLSRNFGKEIALTAGLDHATGDAVVVIDADLQDPPELIAALVDRWREGYDVVYARRIARQGESRLKRLTAFAFYRIVQRVGRVNIPADAGDFRLLSRRAVDALRKLREQHRFMKGLFAWIGFRQIAVPYHRDRRHSGRTKWSWWELWTLALEGITSFTTAPLKIATYLGLSTALVAFHYGLYTIYKTLAYGEPVPGYPSLMVVVLFLGGVQLMTIGIIGEYLGRMFDEIKGRPLYLVNEYRPASSSSARRSRDELAREAVTEECH
jgi:polyisoprenyl-phosphate glycosyltransferase